jgi:hypothetical protein
MWLTILTTHVVLSLAGNCHHRLPWPVKGSKVAHQWRTHAYFSTPEKVKRKITDPFTFYTHHAFYRSIDRLHGMSPSLPPFSFHPPLTSPPTPQWHVRATILSALILLYLHLRSLPPAPAPVLPPLLLQSVWRLTAFTLPFFTSMSSFSFHGTLRPMVPLSASPPYDPQLCSSVPH